ncbi:MAG TPA: hypothetical protein VJR29_03255 [bacterium]|nr:hypothetical protein [bacterium]
MKAHEAYPWEHLSDEALLDIRIKDLKLTIEGSEISELIELLYAELTGKNLSFRPDCYLADEWFVLEGKTSIGIPFYLAHPRLKALEEKMMLECEGGTTGECLKLLRHEAGHAVFYAYRLGKSQRIRSLFGPSPEQPPSSYRPKPYSKSFVRHLDNWYAQAEPDEDFAETFAVWLNPDSNWREYYKGWPALKKLKVVDAALSRLMGRPPKISADRSFAAARSQMKLGAYYAKKQKLYAQDYPDFYDRDLKVIFSADGGGAGESAGEFMRRNRKLIVDKVAQWSGEKKFIVNNLFKRLMERSRQLKMRLRSSPEESMLEITAYLTSMASNYLYTGKFKPTV